MAQPIDLTVDDEWASVHDERGAKRQRTSTLPSQPAPPPVATTPALATPAAPAFAATPSNGTQNAWAQPGTQYTQWAQPQAYAQYPPPGGYPAAYGAPYYAPPPAGYPTSAYSAQPPQTNTWVMGVQKNGAIDLTATPSPPSNAPTPTPSTSTSVPAPVKHDGRTVMCIGELAVTALILYPIRYLAPSNTASESTPASATMPATCTVKLRYDASKKRIGSAGGDQTINISSPTTAAGPGEDFGVVDQKAANVLAPLMERGLIRLEAKVFKGSENVRAFFGLSGLSRLAKA
jgi:hypothetical protein